MSLRRRFEAKVTDWVRKGLRVRSSDELDGDELVDVQAIARLYLVLHREPVYEAALDHIVHAVGAHFSGRDPTPLVRCLLGCLLAEVAERHRSSNRVPEAERTRHLADTWFSDRPSRAVLLLISSLAGATRSHELPGLTTAALVRGLLFQLERSTDVGKAKLLAACAQAAFSIGDGDLLSEVVHRLQAAATSAGYRGLVEFYRSRISMASGKLADRDVAIAALNAIMANLPRSDPAYDAVVSLYARVVDATRISPEYSAEEGSAMNRAAVAMQREDWPAAVRLLEETVAELGPSPLRASMRAFAEVSRLGEGTLASTAALTASLDRLERDDILSARSLIPVEQTFTMLLGQAIDIYEAGDRSSPIARISDFMGEYRGGTAIGRSRSELDRFRGDAMADLTLSELLTQIHPDAASTLDHFPDYGKVWVDLVKMPKALMLVTVVAVAGSPPLVRRVPLTKQETALLIDCMGAESEDVDQDAVERLSALIFVDVPSGEVGQNLIVIPDRLTWSLPWPRLAPQGTKEIFTSISLQSAARLAPVPRREVARVIGIFDSRGLRGSALELSRLLALHASGAIRFTQVHTIAELASTLETGEFDLLTVGVHGESGDGFEYRLLFPEGPSSPTALLNMRLPPRVVLGSCWSAKANARTDTLTTALVCLLAGSSQVIGGLWDINDVVAGEMLAEVYDRYAEGLPLARAMRNAHLGLSDTRQRLSGGLTIFGRPD
ncbi:CHAT domain-containing protein [Phytomonospora sp. NPDC050363]|uniref:CHAT domain-containing protein n=1 Tax=Phytomonospora sp. NPDC050363 TaxID=3155642 RepID=UPI003405CBFC